MNWRVKLLARYSLISVGSLLEFVRFNHLLWLLPDLCLWPICPDHYRISNSVMQPSTMKTLESLGSCLIPLWKENIQKVWKTSWFAFGMEFPSCAVSAQSHATGAHSWVFFCYWGWKIEGKSFTGVRFYTDNKDNSYKQLATE